MPIARKMRLPMTVIVALNAMIGASIFTAPAILSLSVGPAAIVSYALVTVLVLCMALAFSRVTRAYPSELPFYDYAALWGGRWAGRIAMLSYILGLTVAMGLVSSFVGKYLMQYIPQLSYTTSGMLSIWPFVFANMLGVTMIQVLQYALIFFTLAPMAIIAWLSVRNFSSSNLQPFMPEGVSSIFAAVPVIIFGFFGFEAIPAISSSVKNPNKTVPRAMIISVLLTSLIYTLFIFAILSGLSRSAFTSDRMLLSDALKTVYPCIGWFGWFIDWAIIITIWGTLYSMILAIASLIRGFFNIALPWALILVGGAISLSFFVFSSAQMLFDLTSVGVCVAYGMTVAALYTKKCRKGFLDIVIATAGLIAVGVVLYCAIAKYII